MQNLNDLRYFVNVVDHGGFAAAGRALSIPKSKLSRRVAHLEGRLGVKLIERSTRHFSVTSIGERYYEHCHGMLIEAQSAQDVIDMSRAEPCGTIRLTCPVALLKTTVGRMLAAFMADNPRVDLQLEATNRRVDVINEAVDLALRVRPAPIEHDGLEMRLLADHQRCLAASPALLARFDEPATPMDLQQLPSLHHGTPQQPAEWTFNSTEGQSTTVTHRPRLMTGDLAALREAAIAGVGIAQFPVTMIDECLRIGTLRRVLPDWALTTDVVHVVHTAHRGQLPAVKALITFLSSEFGTNQTDGNNLN